MNAVTLSPASMTYALPADEDPTLSVVVASVDEAIRLFEYAADVEVPIDTTIVGANTPVESP